MTTHLHDEEHQASVEYIVRAITSSRSLLVKVVHYLLVDLRESGSGAGGGHETTQRQKTVARKSIESQDSRPVTPVATSAPVSSFFPQCILFHTVSVHVKHIRHLGSLGTEGSS